MRLAERRTKDLARKTFLSTQSVPERAYAAGLIDGEGCVTVSRRSSKDGQYIMAVWVTNTSLPMLEWLRARWGGSISPIRRRLDNRKDAWSWCVSCNHALRFLDDIFEFLVVKRRQAQLARRFQRYVQVTGRARTHKILRVQTRFYDEFRVLNHRGRRAA